MKLSSDDKYKFYSNCANDTQTGATVAMWSLPNRTPHPSYPNTAAFLAEYGSEIPEPEPIEPETQADWVQFRAQVSMHSAYFRLVTGHPQNGVLNDLLVPLLWGVGNEPDLLMEVAAIWNAMETNAPLTPIEIDQLNTIATACHVPLQLDDQGMMVVQLD